MVFPFAKILNNVDFLCLKNYRNHKLKSVKYYKSNDLSFIKSLVFDISMHIIRVYEGILFIVTIVQIFNDIISKIYTIDIVKSLPYCKRKDWQIFVPITINIITLTLFIGIYRQVLVLWTFVPVVMSHPKIQV